MNFKAYKWDEGVHSQLIYLSMYFMVGRITEVSYSHALSELWVPYFFLNIKRNILHVFSFENIKIGE